MFSEMVNDNTVHLRFVSSQLRLAKSSTLSSHDLKLGLFIQRIEIKAFLGVLAKRWRKNITKIDDFINTVSHIYYHRKWQAK